MAHESASNGYRLAGDSLPADDSFSGDRSFSGDHGAAGGLPSGPVISQAIEAVRELADILSRSCATKLVVSVGAIRWEVERHEAPPRAEPPQAGQAAPAIPAPSAAVPSAVTGEAVPAAEPGAAGQVVAAPLVGVFYRAPAPGQPPFAELGSRVEAGRQVAIIEAMKTMNEVLAPCSGTVTQIHVTDSEIVEHGQPLFTIAPGPGAVT